MRCTTLSASRKAPPPRAILGGPDRAGGRHGCRHTSPVRPHPYFFSIGTAALATVIRIAPSSYHRLLWRQPHKEHMLVTSNGLLIAGMGFLAMAMSGSLFFVVSFALGTWEATA